MSIVDTWHLRYEVKAEYPYGTYICNTEAQVREKLDDMKKMYGVACEVRAVGEAVRFYGAPDKPMEAKK